MLLKGILGSDFLQFETFTLTNLEHLVQAQMTPVFNTSKQNMNKAIHNSHKLHSHHHQKGEVKAKVKKVIQESVYHHHDCSEDHFHAKNLDAIVGLMFYENDERLFKYHIQNYMMETLRIYDHALRCSTI